MARKVQDEVEDERLCVQDDPLSPQLISFRRDFKVTELIPHSSLSRILFVLQNDWLVLQNDWLVLQNAATSIYLIVDLAAGDPTVVCGLTPR